MDNQTDSSQSVVSVSSLIQGINDILERADLDAHLACLALSYAFYDLSRSPFSQRVHQLQSTVLEKVQNWRPHDVAVLGVRLAMGWESPTTHAYYADLCEREVRRQPLRPLSTIANDTRLLVGVSAGIPCIDSGASCCQKLWQHANQLRMLSSTALWDYAQACWAQFLLAREDDYSDIPREIAHQLKRMGCECSGRDRIAALWLITHQNQFMPGISNDEFNELERISVDFRKSILWVLDSGEWVDPLEMVFLYDIATSSVVAPAQHYRSVQAALDVIEVFDRAAMRLETGRRKNKAPYTIIDEYDVQDLFHTMLLPALPDLEPEEPTGRDAGSSKKIDFVSRQGRIGIEIKYVDKESQDSKIADQLKIDIESYYIHPSCQTLVCFVYDPYRHVSSAPSIERDLTGTRSFNGRSMEVITRIRPH